MSNRARNFRRRAGDADADAEDDANGGDNPKPSSKPSLSTGVKPKKPQHQAPKRLSFVDDEDNETPSRSSSRQSSSEKSSSRIGKPSSSHKITTLKDRLAHASPSSAIPPSNVQPQAGTYTKETLRELQKNTRTTLGSSSRASLDSKSSSEPIIVLKGLVKPSDPISDAVKQVQELESEDEQEELQEKNCGLVRSVKDDAQAKLAAMGIANSMGSSASFPDEKTIKAIRAERERLRQSRAVAPDYISLDGGSNHGAADGLSDEEPEFRGRIAMFGEKMEGGKKGVFEDVDERTMDLGLGKGSGDDENDEEEKIWEEEQFRKGLGKRMDDGSTRAGGSDVTAVQGVQQQKLIHPAAPVYSSVPSVSVAPSIGGAMAVSQGLDVMPISQQAEVAKKALQDTIWRLKVWICALMAKPELI